MIGAFAKIASDFPDWQIVFAGNGEVEQGKNLAKKLGIAEQTVFLGWVAGKAKDKVFKEATVFVCQVTPKDFRCQYLMLGLTDYQLLQLLSVVFLMWRLMEKTCCCLHPGMWMRWQNK